MMRSDWETVGVPEGWSVRELAHLCRIRSGGTPPKSDPSLWNGPIPWVSGKDLKSQRLKDSIDHITQEAAEAHSEIAPAGSVLVLVRGMGLVNSFALSLIERPMAFNQDLKALIPQSSELSGEYLMHVLTFGGPRMLKRVSAAAHGTKRLSQDDLQGFKFLLPPLREQVLIAEVLDQCKRAIDVEGRASATTREIKKAAMRLLFSRGLRGDMPKESQIGPIPSGWSCVQFGDVREWLQYGTSTRCSVERAQYPVLRIPNIAGGSIDSTELKYCDMEDKEAASYSLKTGDLLFIRTNGVLERLGSCAVYAGDPAGALFASYLIRARLRTVAVPRFLAYFFGSETGTQLIAGRATPAADGKYNLNTGIIDSLPVPLPPTTDEQEEIVNILDAIDKKIDIHQKKHGVLTNLFKSLLHRLMTGELRVSDLDLSALDTAKPNEVPA